MPLWNACKDACVNREHDFKVCSTSTEVYIGANRNRAWIIHENEKYSLN